MLNLEFSCNVLALGPSPHGDYRLGHVAMAASIADIAEQPFDQVASIAATKAMIAHRDDQVRPQFAGDRDPLHAFELQTKICNLDDQIVALHLAQINGDQSVADLQP